MIYFLAHSDWILYNSRKEISDNLIRQYGYKVNAITPDGEFKNRLEKYFSQIHLWEVDRFKLIDCINFNGNFFSFFIFNRF